MMSCPFGKEQAEVFMQRVVKIDEIRQGRKMTPFDKLAMFDELDQKMAWILHPDALKNPVAEGWRIAMLIHESTITAGGDTKFFIQTYLPKFFANTITTPGQNLGDPQVIVAMAVVMVPFSAAAVEAFKILSICHEIKVMELLHDFHHFEFTREADGEADEEGKCHKFEGKNNKVEGKNNKVDQERVKKFYQKLSVILNTSRISLFTEGLIEVVQDVEKYWSPNAGAETQITEGKLVGNLLFKHAHASARDTGEKDTVELVYFPDVFLALTDGTTKHIGQIPSELFTANCRWAFIEARERAGKEAVQRKL